MIRRRTPLASALSLTVVAPLTVVVSLTGARAAWSQPPDEPLESPRATVSQVVGVEAITITYYSPGVKDRAIWGELVPYGQNWRAGANDKTTITFDEEVTIEGETLAPGTYGFYILPKSESEWELVLNSSATGSPNEFDPSEDVVRVTVTPEEAPFRERLRYSIDNFTDWPPYTAEIVLHWEKTKVTLPVSITDRSKND